MKIKEIINLIESTVPPIHAESWDNTGIQIGDPEQEVKGILLALDFNEKVLDEAIEKGANMIITHHPYIFNPLKKITTSAYNTRLIIKAIKNDITVFAAHTNLDNGYDGLNYFVGKKLNLKDVVTLDCKIENNGSGVIGFLPQPMQESDFLNMIKKVLNLKVARHSSFTGKTISKLAICTGSGGFLIEKAIAAEADAFLTGDVRYHDFYIPDNKLLLIDAGHYETEIWATEWFSNIIKSNFNDVKIMISEKGTNPVHYSI